MNDQDTKFQIFYLITVGVLCSLLILLPFLVPIDGETRSEGLPLLLGRFHILVLHLPIGILFIIPILETAGFLKPFRGVHDSVPFMLLLGTLTAIVASVLGMVLASVGGYSGNLVIQHMWGAIITCCLASVSFILRIRFLNVLEGKHTYPYIVFLMLTLGSLTVSAHLGGTLVHGKGFFEDPVENILAPILGGAKKKKATSKDPADYTTVIQPIFEKYCYECHDVDKTKGDYRMDDEAMLFAGGESGLKGIVPGNVDESEIYYRITLPHDDDDVMPPKKKKKFLNQAQIKAVKMWIEKGAKI